MLTTGHRQVIIIRPNANRPYWMKQGKEKKLHRICIYLLGLLTCNIEINIYY